MELNKKNEFVLALREYLKSKYQTEHHYTCGEDNFEGKKVGGAYCLVRRDSNKPKDISGFFLRKDLCTWAPQSKVDILNDVYNFSQRDKNLESVLEKNRTSLTIKFSDKEYLVNTYIEGGCAGEISVYFMELPCFLKKAV